MFFFRRNKSTTPPKQAEVLRKLAPLSPTCSLTTNQAPQLKNNRKKINKMLKRMGRNARQNLSLDAQGVCCIPFKKFLIMVEVPEDDAATCHIQTMVFEVLNAKHARNLALVDSVQLPDEVGIAMEGHEVNLSYSASISKLNYRQLLDGMEAFMQAALDVNSALEGRR